jgi:hypothetical protein
MACSSMFYHETISWYDTADTDIDTSSDGDALFEDMVDDDDEMPDLQECSDDEDEDDEDTRLAEEFDRNQALADADRNVSYFSV